MKLDIFKENWYQTIVKNKQLFVINILLILLCIVLSLKIFITKEKVILVPPKIKSDIVIGTTTANKSYYVQMGLFLTSLIGNQTPKNSSFLMDILLHYFSPDAYQKLKESVLDQISMIKDKNISMIFEPLDVYVDMKKNKVFVKGIQKYKASKHIQKEVKVTYEITFKISNYKIYVSNFIAHTGNFAHIIKSRTSKEK